MATNVKKTRKITPNWINNDVLLESINTKIIALQKLGCDKEIEISTTNKNEIEIETEN